MFEAVRDSRGNEKPNSLRETIITLPNLSARTGFFDLRNVVIQDDIKMNIQILVTRPITADGLWEKILKHAAKSKKV